MTQERQQAFYSGVRELTGKADLKLFTDNLLIIAKTDLEGKGEMGEYPPLGVYKARGFNTKIFKKITLIS